MKFATETLEQVRGELQPLLESHWREIAHYQDIPLDPDWEFYESMQDIGRLRFYTARDNGRLVGYCVFFVAPNRHYMSSLQASQDILFLHPEYRNAGNGRALVLYCDAQLREEGVQAVYQHVKSAHDFGPLLLNCGYELVDLIYAKRLDNGCE
jgi:GNAT superfamily N-acetyltransferase